MNLTKDEKLILLKTARDSIQTSLEGKSILAKKNQNDALNRNSGVFVTLHAGKELRGCIGYVEPIFPLVQATQEAAIKAAMEDPRFEPLTLQELALITIEISVLSPLVELKDIEGIEVGKHGLVIDAGYTRGLLLPQVASEYGWDKKQFLNHTALKAGLQPNAWKQKEIKIYTFTVEKFDETEFGL